jgi:hypothetical protein
MRELFPIQGTAAQAIHQCFAFRPTDTYRGRLFVEVLATENEVSVATRSDQVTRQFIHGDAGVTTFVEIFEDYMGRRLKVASIVYPDGRVIEERSQMEKIVLSGEGAGKKKAIHRHFVTQLLPLIRNHFTSRLKPSHEPEVEIALERKPREPRRSMDAIADWLASNAGPNRPSLLPIGMEVLIKKYSGQT